jgi:hypothetical protein
MGDVFAFFGGMLTIGIALPGMLLAWSLLFPAAVERARLQLERTPWRCFWLGLAALLLSALPLVTLINVAAGPAQFLGWAGVFILLAFASVGAAGLAALMGDRLRGVGLAASVPGALLRGAVALELAAVFPVVGWFIVIPVATICSLGAIVFALLRRAPRALPTPVVSNQSSVVSSQ